MAQLWALRRSFAPVASRTRRAPQANLPCRPASESGMEAAHEQRALLQPRRRSLHSQSRQPGSLGPEVPHGRVVAGLLGREIERRHGDPEYMPARLTVDMYRLPDLSPAEVVTRVVREGRRIKVIDAEFISAGAPMARATCQLLRRTSNPDGQVWSPPPWDVPRPADIPAPEDPRGNLGGMWT